jgi:hypothetical protein
MPARTPIRSATRQSSQLSFGFVQFAVLAQVRCSALRVASFHAGTVLADNGSTAQRRLRKE